MLTTVRQGLSQQVRGRHGLARVFSANDPTGSLQAAWQVKEQLRSLVKTSSSRTRVRSARAAMPETNSLYRTVCRLWQEIEHQANRARLSESGQLQIAYSLEKCRPNGSMSHHLSRHSPGTLKRHQPAAGHPARQRPVITMDAQFKRRPNQGRVSQQILALAGLEDSHSCFGLPLNPDPDHGHERHLPHFNGAGRAGNELFPQVQREALPGRTDLV